RIARQYEDEAEKYPEGHLGRIGNLAEAAKYHDLAAKAATWPRREVPPMTADVNATEKVARELIADAARSHLAMGTEYATRLARRLLSVLSDPDVQAGIAGVLREHGWVYTQPVTASRCVCDERPDDMAEHQATAVADWLRGRADTIPSEHAVASPTVKPSV